MNRSYASIIVIILTGLCSVLLAIVINLATNVVPSSFVRYQWAAWPTVAFLGISSVALAVWQFILGHRDPETSEAEMSERNRRAILEKIRAICVTDILQKSLINEVMITLNLSERSELVERPMDLLVQRPNHDDEPLPPGARILDVYDNLGGELLILGSPGAGKTTLLLELTRDLIERAEQDRRHSIPIVIPLSSWTERRRSFRDWLVDELNTLYYVPRKICETLVDTNQVLPLLDGLDEVKPEYQATCIEAINVFREEHGLLPLVICSRIADYQTVGRRLHLQGAIVVQPLTRQQVNLYLDRIGESLAALSQTLRNDPKLWDLLDTPLVLNIMALIYSSKPNTELQRKNTTYSHSYHILNEYVRQMFQRRSTITS